MQVDGLKKHSGWFYTKLSSLMRITQTCRSGIGDHSDECAVVAAGSSLVRKHVGQKWKRVVERCISISSTRLRGRLKRSRRSPSNKNRDRLSPAPVLSGLDCSGVRESA
jgi:hypothetical protein